MRKIVKNPTFEFIVNENGTVTVFDENMTVIHNVDDIGKIILDLLENPMDENSIIEEVDKVFCHVNYSELTDFIKELIDRQIAIEVQ